MWLVVLLAPSSLSIHPRGRTLFKGQQQTKESLNWEMGFRLRLVFHQRKNFLYFSVKM